VEIEQKLVDIVREQKKAIPEGALTRGTLLADAGLDSLDSLSILFAIEEAFDISIPDESARAVRTLGDLVDLVHGLLPSER
jgi:acyl carrier protein